ncbi:MAG: hypothetical protein R2781_06955 [Flavobacteriaceae bacterium]
MSSLTLGKDSAKDKYEDFLKDYSEYKKNGDSIEKALIVANSAWHLTEWVYNDNVKATYYQNIGEFRESLYPKCPSLKIMHDITTASKHKTLKRPKANLHNTRRHKGNFSRDFSKDFDISYLEIELKSGEKLDFEDEIDKLKIFWDDFFKANQNSNA